MLLAQITEATQAGTELMRTAGQYSAETFMAVLIVGAVVVIVVLLIWKVLIPYWSMKMDLERESAQSSRANTAQLSQAVSSCLPVIANTHEVVTRANATVNNTDETVQRMQSVLRVGIAAIEKLAESANVDISHELSRIHGILESKDSK